MKHPDTARGVRRIFYHLLDLPPVRRVRRLGLGVWRVYFADGSEAMAWPGEGRFEEDSSTVERQTIPARTGGQGDSGRASLHQRSSTLLLPKRLIMPNVLVPSYKDLLWPTLKALEAKGGSASIEELSEGVARIMRLPDAGLEIPHDEGPLAEVDYRAAWALIRDTRSRPRSDNS